MEENNSEYVKLRKRAFYKQFFLEHRRKIAP